MNFKYKERMLTNGLRVVAEISQEAQTAAIGFFINTGARDESTKVMGISHFLEHMMFKGSKEMTPKDVDCAFDDLGANHNAYTGLETTAYWAHAPYKAFSSCVDVLTQILRPALRKVDIENECSVILEEIAMYQDQPFWVLYEQTLESFYPGHPLSNRVLGFEESVKSLTSSDLRDYYNERYGLKNTIVAASGRLSFDSLCKQLEKCCQQWPSGGEKPLRKAPKAATKSLKIEKNSINRAYLIEMIPAPPVQSEDRYVAGMLSAILGGINSSKLYWSLIEPGIAEDAQSQYEGHDGAGEILSFVVCNPEKIDQVKKILEKERSSLIDSIKKEDIESVQRILATTAAMQSEQPAGRMQRIGQMLSTLNQYTPLEKELEKIQSITKSSLEQYLTKYSLKPTVISHLSPINKN